MCNDAPFFGSPRLWRNWLDWRYKHRVDFPVVLLEERIDNFTFPGKCYGGYAALFNFNFIIPTTMAFNVCACSGTNHVDREHRAKKVRTDLSLPWQEGAIRSRVGRKCVVNERCEGWFKIFYARCKWSVVEEETWEKGQNPGILRQHSQTELAGEKVCYMFTYARNW